MNSVSVIIPAYNSPYLGEAIESVFAQTRAAMEIIVVDGSPDSTLKQLEKYGDRIKYFYQAPLGVSAARNLGIRKARGDYVAFLDADDLWLAQKLELQMIALSEHSDAAFSFSTVWNLVQDDHHDVTQEPYHPIALARWTQSFGESKRYVAGSVYDLLLQANCVATSSVVIHKGRLDETGLFDESFRTGEDYEFWLRLAKRYAAVFITQPTSRYRIHGGGLSGTWRDRALPFYEANLRVLQKHFALYPSPAVRRAIARTKAEFAYSHVRSSQSAAARRLALESWRVWPNRTAAKVFLEATCPRIYSLASRIIH